MLYGRAWKVAQHYKLKLLPKTFLEELIWQIQACKQGHSDGT